MNEATVQRRIQDWMRLQGYYVAKAHGSPLTRAGQPDLQICARGMFYALEVKTRENPYPTALQTKRMTEIYLAGGVPFAVQSLDEAKGVVLAEHEDIRKVARFAMDEHRNRHGMPPMDREESKWQQTTNATASKKSPATTRRA